MGLGSTLTFYLPCALYNRFMICSRGCPPLFMLYLSYTWSTHSCRLSESSLVTEKPCRTKRAEGQILSSHHTAPSSCRTWVLMWVSGSFRAVITRRANVSRPEVHLRVRRGIRNIIDYFKPSFYIPKRTQMNASLI